MGSRCGGVEMVEQVGGRGVAAVAAVASACFGAYSDESVSRPAQGWRGLQLKLAPGAVC